MTPDEWVRVLGEREPGLSVALVALGVGQIIFIRFLFDRACRTFLDRVPWYADLHGRVRDSMTLDSKQTRLLKPDNRNERDLLDTWRGMRVPGYFMGGLWIAAGLWGLVQSG